MPAKRPTKWTRINELAVTNEPDNSNGGFTKYKCEYRVNYKMRIIEGEGFMDIIDRHAVFTCASECWYYRDSLVKFPRIENDGKTYMVVTSSIECFGPGEKKIKDPRKKRNRSKNEPKKEFGFPMKECTKCGTPRSLSSFYRSKENQDKRDGKCIKCHTAERMNRGLGR